MAAASKRSGRRCPTRRSCGGLRGSRCAGGIAQSAGHGEQNFDVATQAARGQKPHRAARMPRRCSPGLPRQVAAVPAREGTRGGRRTLRCARAGPPRAAGGASARRLWPRVARTPPENTTIERKPPPGSRLQPQAFVAEPPRSAPPHSAAPATRRGLTAWWPSRRPWSGGPWLFAPARPRPGSAERSGGRRRSASRLRVERCWGRGKCLACRCRRPGPNPHKSMQYVRGPVSVGTRRREAPRPTVAQRPAWSR